MSIINNTDDKMQGEIKDLKRTQILNEYRAKFEILKKQIELETESQLLALTEGPKKKSNDVVVSHLTVREEIKQPSTACKEHEEREREREREREQEREKRENIARLLSDNVKDNCGTSIPKGETGRILDRRVGSCGDIRYLVTFPLPKYSPAARWLDSEEIEVINLSKEVEVSVVVTTNKGCPKGCDYTNRSKTYCKIEDIKIDRSDYEASQKDPYKRMALSRNACSLAGFAYRDCFSVNLMDRVLDIVLND